MLNYYDVQFGKPDHEDAFHVGVIAPTLAEAIKLGEENAQDLWRETKVTIPALHAANCFGPVNMSANLKGVKTEAARPGPPPPPVCGNVNCEYEGTRKESVGICGMDFRLLFCEECHGEYKGPKG